MNATYLAIPLKNIADLIQAMPKREINKQEDLVPILNATFLNTPDSNIADLIYAMSKREKNPKNY